MEHYYNQAKYLIENSALDIRISKTCYIIVMFYFLLHITLASPVIHQTKEEINSRMPVSSEFVLPEESTQNVKVKSLVTIKIALVAIKPPSTSGELLKEVCNVTVTPLEIGNETTPDVGLRNMITVPANCKEGFKMGPDGVCRETW